MGHHRKVDEEELDEAARLLAERLNKLLWALEAEDAKHYRNPQRQLRLLKWKYRTKRKHTISESTGE